MTPSEVRAIVEVEIGDDWSQSNAHKLDLRKCLVEPKKVACRNTFPKLNNGKPLQLWIVSEETPGNSDGYLIVFDEDRNEFATRGLEQRRSSFPRILWRLLEYAARDVNLFISHVV